MMHAYTVQCQPLPLSLLVCNAFAVLTNTFFGLSPIFQSHLGRAMEALGGDQAAKDKVTKWQERKEDWAHYNLNTIRGHENVRTSTPAEQNHSSIAARIPDRRSRSLEQFIVEVIKRTNDIYNERQEALHKYEAATQGAITAMSARDRHFLAEGRRQLHRSPYQRYSEQCALHSSYNVSEVPNGLKVSHTSSQVNFYLILDGERCPCTYVFTWEDMCRHEIAGHVYREIPIFDRSLFSPLHLFEGTLPSMIGPPVTAFLTNDGPLVRGNVASPPEAQVFRFNDAGHNAVSGVNPVGGNDSALICSQVAASPSRVSDPSQRANSRRRNADVSRAVTWDAMNDVCRQLVTLTNAVDNPLQNAVFSHIGQLVHMLDRQDYSHPRHQGTTTGQLASVLQGLSTGEPVAGEAQLATRRHVPKTGGQRTNRLGRTPSKRPQNCGFCGKAVASEGHPGNASRCPLRLGLGECFQIKKTGHKEQILDKLNRMVEGKEPAYDLTEGERSIFKGSVLIHQPPNGAVHIQIKAHGTANHERAILCTCLGRDGKTLVRREGQRSVPYEDVWVKKDGLVSHTGVRGVDCFFFAPIDKRGLEKVQALEAMVKGSGKDYFGNDKGTPEGKEGAV